MSKLREAAQQALEYLDAPSAKLWPAGTQHRIITALRSALAEPVQEPVAKVELMLTGGNAGLATRIVEIDDHLRERLRPGQMLYTAPPQRKPLTLTDLQEALVYVDLIDPDAIDDPENYDAGFTVAQIDELHRRLTA